MNEPYCKRDPFKSKYAFFYHVRDEDGEVILFDSSQYLGNFSIAYRFIHTEGL